jgi:hypothetical protein
MSLIDTHGFIFPMFMPMERSAGRVASQMRKLDDDVAKYRLWVIRKHGKEYRVGIPVTFDRNQAYDAFNEWLESSQPTN